MTKEQQSRTPFEVLGRENEDGDITKEKYAAKQQEGLIKTLEEEGVQQMEGTEEDEGDDMELGELDLDTIEEECGKKGQGYVSRRQIELL